MSNTYAALSSLSKYKSKIFKETYMHNKFKTSPITRNDKKSLPNGSCLVSDIEYQLQYIIKKKKKQ